jgi:hypothetical protein
VDELTWEHGSIWLAGASPLALIPFEELVTDAWNRVAF